MPLKPNILLRHCEPDWGLIEKYSLKGQGVDLVPLTRAGEQQAKALGQREELKAAKLIVSSPATRCLQTGSILAHELNIPVKIGFRLHEWIPDLSMKWMDYSIVQAADRDREKCKGEWPIGESRTWEPLSAVRLRAQEVIRYFTDAEAVIFLTHALVIRSLTGKELQYGEFVVCP